MAAPRLTQSDLRLIHAALCDYLTDDGDDSATHAVIDKIEARLGISTS